MAMWTPRLAGRRGPKYLQIVEAMAEDIETGRLAAGARLPPHRELAYALGLSANTTSRAYAIGVDRALLRGEVGRGTFVRTPGGGPEAHAQIAPNRPEAGPIDLSRNLPTPGLAEPFVAQALADISTAGRLGALLDFHETGDRAAHLAAAVKWLARCGVEAAPDEILITNGAQHGLFCVLSALLRPGDLLLAEALAYPPAQETAERIGARVEAAPLDADGLSPEALDRICAASAPRALYLTPTLQSPTTATLSADRRRAIVEIAERRGLLLIEDDVFGLLKADRPEPIAALAPERTIYLTSVSKCVASGLRVGFVRPPRALAPAIRRAIGLTAWMTPPLNAEIAARLIEDGAADQLIDAHRAAAARRQALAARILSGADLARDPAALHVWLRLPSDWKADVFRMEAARRGALVTEARSFAVRPADAPEAIRLCLSHEPSEERLAAGLRIVAALLNAPQAAEELVL